MKKKPCLVCEFPTDADSGYCYDHSASVHSHNYRMRQKRKAEAKALQLAKTSELSVEGKQKILLEFETSIKKYEGFSGIII